MNWKKVVSVLLAGTMMFSLAACGDSGSGGSGGNGGGGTQGGEETGGGSGEKLVVWTLSKDLVDIGNRYKALRWSLW